MSNLEGKRILIFQQRGWAINIGHFLAKRMQDEGAELAAITLKKSTHNFIIKQEDVKYENILSIDDVLENPEKYLAGENISFQEICDDLKIDSLWPLIHSDRKLVRSYKEKYYYSFKQNVSDEFIVTYIKAYYKALRDLFNKFKPDLIMIVTFVSEEHVLLKLLAEKAGIPIISITDSKVPGYYVFSSDEYFKKGELIDRFNALQKGEAVSTNLEKAKKFILGFREKFKKPNWAIEEKKESLIKKIRHNLAPIKHIYYFYTKAWARENHIKIIDPTPDYRPPKIILRDWWSEKKYKKFAQNFNYFPLEELGKFVFYPLKVTPEGNVDLMCPMYNNQIELARQIAMSLPGDYTLVAREHPAMVGKRPPSYLEKIAATPNVKLIDYRLPIEEVLKKCDMVISTYSTTFFEAAFYHKPVIMLMESGIFELLPNVFKHTDLSSLTKKIKEVLVVDLKTSKYEKQLENYISAVYDTGFDYDYASAWEKGEGRKDELWEIYKKEIERVIK